MRRLKKISPFQGRLAFPTSARASVFAEHAVETVLLRTLVCTLIALSCAYIYFVVSSSLSVIGANAARADSMQLQSMVGLVEREYFTVASAVSPARAAELELAPVSKISYVRRPSETASVAKANSSI